MKRVALSIIFILLSTASVIAAGGIIPPYIDAAQVVLKGDTDIPQSVNTAVWSTINDWIQGVGSPGIINGGNLSYDTSTDTLCISNGFGIFQEAARDYTASGVKVIKWFSFTNSCFKIPLGTNEYIYMDESSAGSGPHLLMQDVNQLSTRTKWQMFRIYAEEAGKRPYILATYPDLKSYTIRDNDRLLDVRNFQPGSGLSVSFATNFFHGEAGTAYAGNNKITLTNWYSDWPGNEFDNYYCTNTVLNSWVEIGTNCVDVNRFNSNGVALAAAGKGSWLSYWLYLNVANEPAIIYGSGQYATKSDAYSDPIPTQAPRHFANFCTLVCQLVTTQGCPNIIEVRKNGTFVSGTSQITDHDALNNRNSVGNHTAYLDLTGTRPMTGNLNMGNHEVSNVHAITIGTDVESNSFFTILQAPVIGGHGACAWMWGGNPVSPAGAAVGPVFSGRRALGTQTSPLAVTNNIILVSYAGRGWDGTAFGASSLSDGQIALCAAETFTPTEHGTYWAIKTTATGTTSRLTRMTVDEYGIHGAGTHITNVNAQFFMGYTSNDMANLYISNNNFYVEYKSATNTLMLQSVNGTNSLRTVEIAALYVSNNNQQINISDLFVSNNNQYVEYKSATNTLMLQAVNGTNSLRTVEIAALINSNSSMFASNNNQQINISDLFKSNNNFYVEYKAATNTLMLQAVNGTNSLRTVEIAALYNSNNNFYVEYKSATNYLYTQDGSLMVSNNAQQINISDLFKSNNNFYVEYKSATNTLQLNINGASNDILVTVKGYTNAVLNTAQTFSDVKTNGLATQVQQWTNAVLVAAYAKDDAYSNTIISMMYNPPFAQVIRTNGVGYAWATPTIWTAMTNWIYSSTNVFDATVSNITVRAASGGPTTMYVKVHASMEWSQTTADRGVNIAIFKNGLKVGPDSVSLNHAANASQTMIPAIINWIDLANALDVYEIRMIYNGASGTVTEWGGSFMVEKK